MAAPTLLIHDEADAQSGAISVTAPGVYHFRLGDRLYQPLNAAEGFEWVPSAVGGSTYYARALGGGAPAIGTPSARRNRVVYVSEKGYKPVSLNNVALNEKEWGYGRMTADSLAFDTIYIRVRGGTPDALPVPDSLAQGPGSQTGQWVWQSWDNIFFDFGAGDDGLSRQDSDVQWSCTHAGGPAIEPTKVGWVPNFSALFRNIETSIRSAAFRYDLVTGEEYELRLADGSLPSLVDVAGRVLYEDGRVMATGSAGSLARGQWAWSGGTIRVRLSDGADPDSKAAGWLEHADPRTETVTLTLTNSLGESSQVQRTLTVLPASTTRAFISAGGLDSPGRGTTRSNPYRTATYALSDVGVSTVRHFLIEGSGSYTHTGVFEPRGAGVRLVPYGSGRPFVSFSGGNAINMRGHDFLAYGLQLHAADTNRNFFEDYDRIRQSIEDCVLTAGPGIVCQGCVELGQTQRFRHLRAIDASALTAGITKNFVFAQSSTAVSAHPCGQLYMDDCKASPYGAKLEQVYRLSGDYTTVISCTGRQSGLRDANGGEYTKTSSVRIVNGVNVSILGGDYGAVLPFGSPFPLDSQGVGGVTISPADAGNPGFVRWMRVSRAKFANSQVFSIETLNRVEDVTIDACISDCAVGYHVPALGGVNQGTVRRVKFVRCTHRGRRDKWRPIYINHLASQADVQDVTLEDLLLQNPDADVVNNDSETSVLLGYGEGHLAGIRRCCFSAPSYTGGGGSWVSPVVALRRDGAGNNRAYQSLADLNAETYGDANFHELVNLDSLYRVPHDAIAATAAGARQPGIFRDFHGNTFAASGGPVGAVASAQAAPPPPPPPPPAPRTARSLGRVLLRSA